MASYHSIFIYLLLLFFLAALGLELKASHLLGRSTTIWATPLAPYHSIFYQKIFLLHNTIENDVFAYSYNIYHSLSVS
jgi:hypothetical protein